MTLSAPDMEKGRIKCMHFPSHKTNKLVIIKFLIYNYWHTDTCPSPFFPLLLLLLVSAVLLISFPVLSFFHSDHVVMLQHSLSPTPLSPLSLSIAL